MDETYDMEPMMEARKSLGGVSRKPTIQENLLHRKGVLEKQLDAINAAIEGLNKNPEVSKVLELIGKANAF